MVMCEGFGRDFQHKEIVFEGNECPLCKANDKITALESEIEDLESN